MRTFNHKIVGLAALTSLFLLPGCENPGQLSEALKAIAPPPAQTGQTTAQGTNDTPTAGDKLQKISERLAKVRKAMDDDTMASDRNGMAFGFLPCHLDPKTVDELNAEGASQANVAGTTMNLPPDIAS